MTWIIHTNSYVWHGPFTCEIAHSCLNIIFDLFFIASFMIELDCELIHTCDMTHSYVWHNSIMTQQDIWPHLHSHLYNRTGLLHFHLLVVLVCWGMECGYEWSRCNTLQHAANTLQHATSHCNTWRYTIAHCNTLQYTATLCNMLQHTVTHCNALLYTAIFCKTLHYTTTHCNTLQHSVTHCTTL